VQEFLIYSYLFLKLVFLILQVQEWLRQLGEAMIRENMALIALIAKIRESMAIIYQQQNQRHQAVLEFNKCLVLEIKVRSDNHPLSLLFKSMLQRRADKIENFEIPTEQKWSGILQALNGESEGKKLDKVARRSADKQIKNRGLVILPRMGQAEALKGTRGWYVHQGEVFWVLMAALEEAESIKQLKDNVKKEYCNITNEVVDDFLRALDVCYHLAGPTVVSAPAGIMRFECVCPPPRHKEYMDSEYLQAVLLELERTGADADLNETAAERFKAFLARNTTAANVCDFWARRFLFLLSSPPRNLLEDGLALAMGLHPRLGAGCILSKLSVDIFRIVLRHLSADVETDTQYALLKNYIKVNMKCHSTVLCYFRLYSSDIAQFERACSVLMADTDKDPMWRMLLQV
jgi:hypothetical protein